MKSCRSLPPLVQGKIHGYLRLVIDEVIWSKKGPGEIRVFASWWGETDSAQFRPADIAKHDSRSEDETSEIYAIRTNINLFEKYIENCETVELVIVSEATNTIVGTSQITDLSNIFQLKPCFKYFPMFNNCGNRIGEIHVSTRLIHMAKHSNMQLKYNKHEKNQAEDVILAATNANTRLKNVASDRGDLNKKSEAESNIYKSILKPKTPEFQEPLKKFSNKVTDNLVAQVVARAQRLRGAILKQTCNEDSLALSDSCTNDGLQNPASVENEAKLYEYFLGKEMTSFDEHRALSTLRSTSPTTSLLDLASESIAACRVNNKNITPNNAHFPKTHSSVQARLPEENLYDNRKETLLLNHVDCIRIFVDSFVLSPAGYRRVKSSSLSRNEGTPLSVTYFVQYDTTFAIKQAPRKSVKDNKSIRICSKKQMDQVIYFHHDGVYGIAKLKLHTDYIIKFKMFVRHLNQKSPTELGVGSMYISDITKTENCSTTQRLAIVNKGIKIGELNVTGELGSDFTHFGKQYVDGIMSAKENVPVLEMQSLLNVDTSKRSKNATGTHSKTNSRVSSAPDKGVDRLTNHSNTNLFATKDKTQPRKENMDDRRIDVSNLENSIKDKILLHGLIYVAEGKELPELNTYLICRAFWREDKSTSQICNNTKNPFYNFCQLVPLIHGTDLLDRIKDNYIVIEVYSRTDDADNLLGLAKLSVHQLYVAYRDPLVLPHLLLSKYPVISVDGWVPIINPVTGDSGGQILALVALGTIEQIALLEMSRGLRNISGIPQTMVPQDNNFEFRTINTAERESHFSNLKTQESQTDITTLKETLNSEHLVLHNLVDRLAQVLTANKAATDRAAQTECALDEKKPTDVEEQICLNELNYNHVSDESDSSSLRNNFHLPTEMYRSVGVGAEYDEELNQQSNAGYANIISDSSTTNQNTEKEQTDAEYIQTMFRAVVEIECAFHLPKVEKANETVEPNTYITFQADKSNPTNQLNSCMITNVFQRSCNPKWNWKCDTRLSTELLFNDEKRLILKVWRILEPDINTQINLERDIVIGFSAIDLSVLVTGFPTVSGWFHIMDFTGKCNGQIKVSITPLDNLSSFMKPSSILSTTRLPVSNVSQSSWSPSYHEYHPVQTTDVERSNVYSTLSISTHQEEKSVNSENQLNDPVAHVGNGFEDASISFLSLSLKKKLTELDEITKRLETRLRDVTNTAFDDDFENEFDLNEMPSDNENNDQRNTDAAVSTTTATATQNKTWQIPHAGRNSLYDRETVEDNDQTSTSKTVIRDHSADSRNDRSRTVNYEMNNTSGPSKIHCSIRDNYPNDVSPTQDQNEYSGHNNKMLDNDIDYPERGTKTHINHLLDKLSLQLPVRSFPTKAMPIQKNIFDLLTNLHKNNNNIQVNTKCNQELKVCTVPTQTDNVDVQNIQNSQDQTTNSVTGLNDEYNDRNQSEASAKSQATNRVSTVIREELIAEENSDTTKCDELTTYLITSNVRHMDLDSIFNPLLYQHLVPDLHHSNTVSPDGEAVEELDNRYIRAFGSSIDNRLSKVQNPVKIIESSTNQNSTEDGHRRSILESPENAEPFRMTPSGVSENVDGNIDLTVIHKSSYDDLLASNSTESTATASPEESSIKQLDVETTENSFSTSSDTSVPALSRQAPDGGNPVEDITKPLIVQQQDNSQDSSLSS